MKTLEELQHTPHLCVQGKMPTQIIHDPSAEVYHGWVDIGDFKGTVVFGFNEHGVWEHVSISHFNKRKLPTWDDMCRIKEMFWGKDVTVVQFHPAEGAYIHSVKGLENVLHLWRPKDGDWSRINEDLMKTL